MKSGPVTEKLQLKDVDFGVIFDKECHEISYGKGDREAKKVEDVRNRAWAFMLKLLEETEKRLPSNIAVFKQQAFFSPATVLGTTQKRFGEMPFRECVENDEDLAELEEQWRQVSQVAWAEAEPFKSQQVPSDPVIFWMGVGNYRVGGTTKAIDEDAATVDDPATDGETDDHKIFQKLANFVLGRLTIAHSTAAVERTFSIVSCVKSKLRNRMSTSTLEAILRCRTYLYNRGKCCKSLEVTAPMLSLFTSQIYGPGEENRPTPSVAVSEQDEQDLSIENEVTYYLPPLHDL
jgi:hypothetical protein